MPADVRIPTLGESITEGVIVRWIKADGDAVAVDESLLELETDKASVEIPAETAGTLTILKPEGATVQVGDVVGRIESAGAAVARGAAERGPTRVIPAAPTPPATTAAPANGPPAATLAAAPMATPVATPASALLSPAVRKLVEEHGLDPRGIPGSGRGGRLTKGDILAHLEQTPATGQPAAHSGDAAPATAAVPSSPPSPVTVAPPVDARRDGDERVPMTHLRKRIAERLVQAQHTAAILTTFNEVDMTAVLELRARHKDRFKQAHGVSLGFMSFFARACIGALHESPIVNAQIDGDDVVYKAHVHLGIAVGTERGLVVPVIHDAEQLTFAAIEKEIDRLAGLARQGKLSITDLSGGTFTISNGGVYGSLLSTPILTPPQSAILGMHKIEKRPIVVADQIVIRPMMYLALSYDHRLVDGEQAVRFLVHVKERIEDPTRLLFEA